jgi:NAD+ synthase (glutamine-hydrolysing)
MRVGLGQFNAVVGDLGGNAHRIREFYARAARENVDLLLFPELSVCGYPPEDLVLKKHFLEECAKSIEKIATDCPDITLIVGFVGSDLGGCYNSAAVLQGGKILKIYRKGRLPNYGVFDERRYFQPGIEPLVINVGGIDIAVTICYDIWDIVWLSDFLKNSGPFRLLVNI